MLDESVLIATPSRTCLALSGHIARSPSHDCLRMIASSGGLVGCIVSILVQFNCRVKYHMNMHMLPSLRDGHLFIFHMFIWEATTNYSFSPSINIKFVLLFSSSWKSGCGTCSNPSINQEISY